MFFQHYYQHGNRTRFDLNAAIRKDLLEKAPHIFNLLDRLNGDESGPQSITSKEWKLLYEVLYSRRRRPTIISFTDDDVILVLKLLQRYGSTADLPFFSYWDHIVTFLWAHASEAIAEQAEACIVVLGKRSI